MTVTPLRPRATDPVPPPAIDMDAFRHVTAALTCCATDAAPAASDPAGGTERNKRLARAIHANMELWGAVLHAVIHEASRLPPPLRDHLVELAESATARMSCAATPRSIRSSPSTARSSRGCS